MLVLLIGIAIIWIVPTIIFVFRLRPHKKKEKLQANVNVSLFFVITVYSNDKLRPPKSNIRTQRVRRKCKLLILVKNASLVKRGRGRPRKDSLGSNMSHVQAYFLDEGKTHRKLLTYHIIYNNYADLSYTVGSHIHPTHTHTNILTYTYTHCELKYFICRFSTLLFYFFSLNTHSHLHTHTLNPLKLSY